MHELMQGHFVDSFIQSGEYDLIRNVVGSNYRGEGRIVDAGCFAGTSTRALCEGVLDSEAVVANTKPVIAIDRFVANDDYVCNHFLQRGIDVRFGESFLPLFMDHLGPHLQLIEVRAGELLQIGRINAPIEVLLIDIAKTAFLNSYVVRNWYPLLIPLQSVVIQQDFYTPAQPWIAVSMGSLLDFFDVMTPKVGESCVFALKKRISLRAIDAAVSINAYSSQALPIYDRVIELLGYQCSAPIKIMKALALHFMDCRKESRALLEELWHLNPKPSDTKWLKWLSLATIAIYPDIYSERSLIAEAYVLHARPRLGGFGIE